MTEQEDKTEKKDDPVALFIFAHLKNAEGPVSPDDVARAYYETRAKKGDKPDLWRKFLPAVRQQALFLARQDRLLILHRGEEADPRAPIKGLIKLTLPRESLKAPKGRLS